MPELNVKSPIWRGTVGVLIGLLCFLTSFIFTKVVAMPEDYVTKVDNKEMHQVQKERVDQIEKDIKEGFKTLQEQYIEINQYLRDNAAEKKKAKNGG